MEKYIETIIMSTRAMVTLIKICDELKNIANEDNYTEAREEELIHQLVDNGRVAMKAFPSMLDIYRDLNYGERENDSQVVIDYKELFSKYNVVNSIVCSENAYAALKDGANWTRYDKYEEDSDYAFNSVKELLILQIRSMSRLIENLNSKMLIGDALAGYRDLTDLEYELSKVVDVADITSLYNTLSSHEGLNSNNQEAKANIRSIMGLVDGSIALSRKLNISEKDALELQTISNFRIAGKLIYMKRFALNVIDKNIELVSAVAKSLEFASVNAALAVDSEMIDIYPRIHPMSIELLSGNLELSVGFNTDVSTFDNREIRDTGLVKSIEDFEVFNDHLFTYSLITSNGKADMHDAVRKADLDQLYSLFAASCIAITLATGELLAGNHSSVAIKKPAAINNILDNLESINKLINEKIWSLKKNDDHAVLTNTALNQSLNNLISRKQLLAKASTKLIKTLSWEFIDSETSQSAKNNIIIAHRVISQL